MLQRLAREGSAADRPRREYQQQHAQDQQQKQREKDQPVYGMLLFFHFDDLFFGNYLASRDEHAFVNRCMAVEASSTGLSAAAST